MITKPTYTKWVRTGEIAEIPKISERATAQNLVFKSHLFIVRKHIKPTYQDKLPLNTPFYIEPRLRSNKLQVKDENGQRFFVILHQHLHLLFANCLI